MFLCAPTGDNNLTLVVRWLKGFEPSRTRTCDPLVKSQLLYQLSYRPIYMQRARAGVLFCEERVAFYRT
jgi:hypothetical protein